MEAGPEILFYLLFIPNMLLALSIHEASHAGVAFLRGDDTAALQGRMTLNPISHIDPVGLIAFFIIHFGWARPVPVNPLRFKHPRGDEILVSGAGAAANLLLGLGLLFLLRLVWSFDSSAEPARMAMALLFIGAQLNIGLCFFNLLPIPPLDGGHILMGILPAAWARKLEPVMNAGPWLFLALILLSRYSGFNLFGYVIHLPMALIMWGVLGEDVFFNLSDRLAGYLL